MRPRSSRLQNDTYKGREVFPMRKFICFGVTTCFLLMFSVTGVLSAGPDKTDKEKVKALTTSDPYVPVEELTLLLTAYTKDELLVEAASWQGILREKAIEIGKAEIAVKRQNREIEKAAEIKKQAQEAGKKLEELEEKAEAAKQTGDAAEIEKAEKATEDAQEIVGKINKSVDEAAEAAEKTAEIHEVMNEEKGKSLDQTAEAASHAEQALDKVEKAVTEVDPANEESVREAAGIAKDAASEAQKATDVVETKVGKALEKVEEQRQQLEAVQQTQDDLEQVEASKREAKIGLLDNVNALREERTRIIDNFKAVLTELAEKTDQADSKTQALLIDYNLYIKSVQGINLDVQDATSSWIVIRGWLLSEEGGIRFALNFLRFVGVLFLAWLCAGFAGKLVKRAISLGPNVSRLLSDFLIKSVRWIVMFIGVIMALSALEISVAPVLAMVGAAGFIIALALQDSLSNFASGIMILFFRPFDVGDLIDAAGVSGKVSTMNLVSTTIRTADNKKMVVPNNKVWQNVITNATGVRTRRVDLIFGIGYDDNIEEAQKIMEEVVASHPMVLRDPEPTVKLHALADSSVNFICRPWVASQNYWDVYWDITREVKLKFDEAGINIPYPQQDVHLYVEQGQSEKARP